MIITIDPSAGFCPGVKQAVKSAEKALESSGKIYCIGEIVHNEQEMKRLESAGMDTIGINNLPADKKAVIVLRAHGEPPDTYAIIEKAGNGLIDATCPVVKRLQQKVGSEWKRVSAEGGTLVIFGKHHHPEVTALNAQTDYNGFVVGNVAEATNLQVAPPVAVFAQTTASPEGFREVVQALKDKLNGSALHAPSDFVVHNSVCSQVTGRVKNLRTFAEVNDLVLLVGGRNSSNSRYLFGICNIVNSNTRFISSAADLKPEWFTGIETVGITGGTSTPLRQLESIADYIKTFV